MTLTARLDAWTEAARAREQERKLRRANRTPREVFKAKLFGAGYWLFVIGAITWVLGGVKGVTFILKVLFVALHVGAMMDIDLDAADRQAAVDAMLKALDKNSGAVSLKFREAFSDDSDAKQVAMGFLLTNESGPIISAIQDGSPAQMAGLRVGDRITRIHGKDVSENYAVARDFSSAIDMFIDENSAVAITVLRQGQTLDLEMQMTPWEPLRAYDLGVEKGVAHVFIPQFLPGTAEDVAEIIAAHLEKTSVSAVMIDLRGNPGGLAREKLDLAALFVPKGTEVTRIIGRRAYGEITKTASKQRFPEIKQVGVIIDGDSASASEGFAAFVRDQELGPIAGEKSYGKGSRQGIFGSRGIAPFRITVSRFTGPKGTPIDGVGISPDIEAELGDDEHPDWTGLITKLRSELAETP